ncbi:unnamed protein product [Lepeophtheirus salmonis]|uniref:(salmon louse) hypothetical protein n=1 Tax=Lepeophtheirus salmonis TaxID=72036 RepID=A0A7R8CM71_LEPSM|nr:unnamed protein product [Lepeophtheirus salmonis]CAF2818905.1 unnamed protein product [Lepeophtheirus salmonis]
MVGDYRQLNNLMLPDRYPILIFTFSMSSEEARITAFTTCAILFVIWRDGVGICLYRRYNGSFTVRMCHNHIKKVLQVLKDNDLAYNVEKSEFCNAKIEFLGHVNSENAIRPTLSRLNNILINMVDWEELSKIHE